MQRFKPSAYYRIGYLLERARSAHLAARRGGDVAFAGSAANDVLGATTAAGLSRVMQDMQTCCLAIGLEMSAKQAQDIGARSAILTNRKTAEGLEQLNRIIQWEMDQRLFLFVPPDRANWYENLEIFGEEVSTPVPIKPI